MTLASAPQRKRSDRCSAALSESQSEPQLFCGIFVEFDEIAQGHGKVDVFGGAERIKSQRILETSDDNCKAKRIEPRLQKH